MVEKILVVDDEESIRFTFDIFLGDEGYEVITAESYDQAIAEILSTDFNLIFADIIMEGKSGIDLLHKVNKLGINTPVIIITGAPSILTATEALRQGAFDYIIKPINQDTLIRLVSVALRHKSLIDEKEKCQQNFESIFRSVREGILSLDKNMLIQEINDSALSICDLARGDVIGRSPLSLKRKCSGACLELLEHTFASHNPQKKKYIECFPNTDNCQTVSITTSPITFGKKNAFTGTVMLIQDETQLVQLQRTLNTQPYNERIKGKSKAMGSIRKMIKDLADIQTTVLITGESGTGKELVVDSLHQYGERHDKPLVKVNCAALSEDLLESEMFGHVKGAFTGAIRDKIGRFQRADKGTIFLDEIGDISPRMQAKLLRVLETMEFERVGDSSPLKVDVRVVAATNRDLKHLVEKGRFREDLYYRLKVVEIHIPPLRERRDDITLLTNYFLTKYNNKFNKSIKEISSDTWDLFFNYDWPGNVRELENIMEHAFVCCHDDVITTANMPADLLDWFMPPPHATEKKEPHEGDSILEALEKARWNKSKAADLLGISRRTIYRKMKKYGVEQ